MSNFIRCIIAVLLLSGCAFVSSRTDYKGDDAGLVVLGIGASSDTRFDCYQLDYRNMDTKKPYRFIYFPLTDVYDQGTEYKNENEAGTVEAIYLKPGKYELYQFFMTKSFLGMLTTLSREDFSIPFEIIAGETTYLGNYQANKIVREDEFGYLVEVGGFFVVSDRMAEEIEAAKKLKPEINTKEIHNFVHTLKDAQAMGFFLK